MTTARQENARIGMWCLSYFGLLVEIKNGTVAVGDLDQALFHFGRTKNQVTRPSRDNDPIRGVFAKNLPRGEEVRRLINEALERAESACPVRVIWRKSADDINTWDELNALISLHGFPKLDPSILERPKRHYRARHAKECALRMGIRVCIIAR